ncbi:hypothetical protein AB0C83_41700, partial [Streptomyces sp. NPDC048663]
MPSWLEWTSKLAGGGWPKGDEDKLWELATAHREFGNTIRGLIPEIDVALEQVRGGLSGPAADAFEAYLAKLKKDLPTLADAGDQLADLAKNMGLQVQYSKIMILEMLIWMAAQIAFLAWWAPEAVPGIVAAGTAAIKMILTRLLAAVAINVAMAGLMDAIAQLIQLGQTGEAHRTGWDFDATKMALGAGAINGAVAGLMFTGAGAVAPGLLASLAGKMGVGAAAGALGMELTDLAFGIEGEPGLGALAGAVGGAIGHIPAVRGGKGGAGARGAGDIEVPGLGGRAPDLSGGLAEGGGAGGSAGSGGRRADGYGDTSREGGEGLPADLGQGHEPSVYSGGRQYGGVPLSGEGVRVGQGAQEPVAESAGAGGGEGRGGLTDLTGFGGEGGAPLTVSHPGEGGAGGGSGSGSGGVRRSYDDVSEAGSGAFNDDVTVSGFGPGDEPLGRGEFEQRWPGGRQGEEELAGGRGAAGVSRGEAGEAGFLAGPQGLPGFGTTHAAARELPGFGTQKSAGSSGGGALSGVERGASERPGLSGASGAGSGSGRLTEEALGRHEAGNPQRGRSAEDIERWMTEVEAPPTRAVSGPEDLARSVDTSHMSRTGGVAEPEGRGQHGAETEFSASPGAVGDARHGSGSFAPAGSEGVVRSGGPESSAPVTRETAHEEAPAGGAREVVPERSPSGSGQQAPVGSVSGREPVPVEAEPGRGSVVAGDGEDATPAGQAGHTQGQDTPAPAPREPLSGLVDKPEHGGLTPQLGHEGEGAAPVEPAHGRVAGKETGAGGGLTGAEDVPAREPVTAPLAGAVPAGHQVGEQGGGMRLGEPRSGQPPHEPQASSQQAPLGSGPVQRQAGGPVVQAPGREPVTAPRPATESVAPVEPAGGPARLEGGGAAPGAKVEQAAVAGVPPRTAAEPSPRPEGGLVPQGRRDGAVGAGHGVEGGDAGPENAHAGHGHGGNGSADGPHTHRDQALRDHVLGDEVLLDGVGGEIPRSGPRERAYVYSPDDPTRVDGFNAAHERSTRALGERLGWEEQRFWQQQRADEALTAAQVDYVQGENRHGVPGAGRPDPQAWARQLVPEEFVAPVAEGYRAAARTTGVHRSGDAEGRPAAGGDGMFSEQHLIEALSERLGGRDHGLSLDDVARGMIRQAQDAGPQGWARRLGVPDELVGPVVEGYREALHEGRPRGVDGEAEGGAGVLPGAGRVREHVASRLEGVEHGLSVDRLADGLVREQARADRGGLAWRERVESRFNERWQADLEELQRGEIAPLEFEQRFDAAVAGLHDEFELAAAADSARMSAEHAFDTAPGRPSSLPPADEARVRSDFAEAAAREVYKAAAGVEAAEGGRIEWSDWAEIHQRAGQEIGGLTAGLRARLEAEEHAANGFDFVGRITGTSRGRLEELREEFARDFEESTRRLGGDGGPEVRRLPQDQWQASRPRFERLADEVIDRWHGRLRAETAEAALRTQAERVVGLFQPQWRQRTAHPDEFDRVDGTQVLDEYRDAVRDRARGELEGRAPQDISSEQWAAYAQRLREADAALPDQLQQAGAELRARFEYQAGLQGWLRRADAQLRDLPGDEAAVHRAREGVREELTDGYREVVGRPEEGVWSEHELAARQDQFRRMVYEPALESAPDRVAFEEGAGQALRDAAGRLHGMTSGVNELTDRAARHVAMKDETFDKLAGDYRSETGKQYHEYFGPARRDLDTWLQSEKAGGDAFGNGLRERWEDLEGQSPHEQRLRQQAATEAAAWRAQLRDTFGDHAGRQSALEDLQRTAGLDPRGFDSAQAVQSYERGAAGLRNDFTKAWNEAREGHTPQEAAGIRAELVEQTRERWQALRDGAQAHEAEYQNWRNRPTWTLRYPQLDISRNPFRYSGADEHTTDQTTPTSAEHPPQDRATAHGGLQETVQPPAQHRGTAPHETVRQEPQPSAASAGQQTATPAPHVSPARAAADARAAAELDRLWDELATRDEAYHEFQTHLDTFPHLKSSDTEQHVSALREWYADARTTPPAGGRQVPLDEQLHQRLRQADTDLAAHQTTRALFDDQVQASLPSPARSDSFASSARVTQLRNDFHDAVMAAADPAVTASADDLRAALQAPPAVAELFRQEFVEARTDWMAAQSSFHQALQTHGPSGLQDLGRGSVMWDTQTREWYQRQLEQLRERYSADWAALESAQDRTAEQSRLEEQLRQAAQDLQTRAAPTAGALRAFHDHQQAAPWQPDSRWDPQLTSWYEDQKTAIAQPLQQRLSEQGPWTLPQAQQEYDTRTAALQQTAQTRHRISQDFHALLTDRPPQHIQLTTPEMARWTTNQIDTTRNTYIHTR